MMSGRNGATTVNQAAIGRNSSGALSGCVSMPVGLAAAREAVLPPADIVHTALLPLAGEGARRADEARAQRAALALLLSGNRNQDQELSRRDGASHLSLLVQRNLAQRNTPRLRARCCAPGSRSRRDFPRGHPAPAENAAHPCAAPCGSCPPSPPLRRGPQGQDQKPKPKPKPKAKAKAKALSPANL